MDQSRRKPNLRSRVAAEMAEAVVALAIEQPEYGQVRVSNDLRNRSQDISPSGGGWQRYDLESFKKRLKALEKKVVKEGLILSEGQHCRARAATPRQRSRRRNRDHPSPLSRLPGHVLRGYAQGRGPQSISRRSSTPTRSGRRQGCIRRRWAITATDLLNDRVLPFSERQGTEVLRILTDRGTEYCGRHEHLISSSWP